MNFNSLVVFAVLSFVASSHSEERLSIVRPMQKLGRKMLGIEDKDQPASNIDNQGYVIGVAPTKIRIEKTIPLAVNVIQEGQVPVAYNTQLAANLIGQGSNTGIPNNDQIRVNFAGQDTNSRIPNNGEFIANLGGQGFVPVGYNDQPNNDQFVVNLVGQNTNRAPNNNHYTANLGQQGLNNGIVITKNELLSILGEQDILGTYQDGSQGQRCYCF